MARRDDRPATSRIEDAPAEAPRAREYIQVTPAEASPAPDDVQRGFRRLHAHLQNREESGWLGSVLGGDPRPSLEVLVVSAGGEAAPIRYLVGTTADDDPAELDALETALRTVFPVAYEFDRVDCHPAALLTPATNASASASTTSDATADATADGVDETDDPQRKDGPYVAGVEFTGSCEHPLDWQTRLDPYGDGEPTGATDDSQPTDGTYRSGPAHSQSRTEPRSGRSTDGTADERPLSGLIETMANADYPVVYQVLLRPKHDWNDTLEMRHHWVEKGLDSFTKQIRYAMKTDQDAWDPPLTETAEQRLDELQAKDARHSFEVTSRAAVVAPADHWDTPAPVDAIARQLATGLRPLGHTTYEVAGRVRVDDQFHSDTHPPGQRVLAALVNREHVTPPPRTRWQAVRRRADRQSLVADVAEAPAFCVLDGAGLPATATRALAPRPSERTAIVPPPEPVLDTYRGEGMYIGHVTNQDGKRQSRRLVVPPGMQHTHCLVVGKSGSGKSVLMQTAARSNHGSGDGPTFIVDRKGDGFPEAYLQTHYCEHDTLEDVVYFDTEWLLPALSILDIRPDLEAGRSRLSAVEDRADYLEEALKMRLGGEQYDQAVRSPDIIQYLVKAAFDPIHGADAVTYADLQGLVTRLQDRREVPPTVDPAVADGLASVAANSARSFDDVMEGVKSRLEELQTDSRLYGLFNYVPEDRDSDDPLFSFDDLLDEDTVVIFDVSDMRIDSQQSLVLVLLAQLWAALKRRQDRRERADRYRNATADPDEAVRVADETAGSEHDDREPPVVNLFVEEASEIAASDMVTTFLQEARGFNCGVTLAMQFPEQLRANHEGAYREVLNDISTVITGNVGHDEPLAKRYATDDMDATAVANRIRNLAKGEWLVSMPAPFGESEPRPFLMESAKLPPGHPEGTQQLSEARETAFKSALMVRKQRTAERYGLLLEGAAPEWLDTESVTTIGYTATARDDETEGDQASDATTPSISQAELQSALPHTKRLPDVVEYDEGAHSLVCAGCYSRAPVDCDGMVQTITCCNSLGIVDRDDVPICQIPLTLSAEEVLDLDLSLDQLLFLQAVEAGKRGTYDDLEYDLRRDSMVRLREYVGIEQEGIDELVASDLVKRDGDRPHRLYTVNDDGLAVLGEQQREGITYGDGVGDLGETTKHRMMVLDCAAWLDQAYVQSADSEAVEVKIYHEVGDYRYDVVALDADGEIVIAVEAERGNNDLLEAAPEDYDKLAAADPEEAVWIVDNRDTAHGVLNALNDPTDNDQRVAKTYSESSAPRFFNFDTSGLSDMHTLGYLRNTLLGE